MIRSAQVLVEPTLGELLEDPIVRLVMASDRVEPAHIRALARRFAARARDGQGAATGDAADAASSPRIAHPARLPAALTRALDVCGAC